MMLLLLGLKNGGSKSQSRSNFIRPYFILVSAVLFSAVWFLSEIRNSQQNEEIQKLATTINRQREKFKRDESLKCRHYNKQIFDHADAYYLYSIIMDSNLLSVNGVLKNYAHKKLILTLLSDSGKPYTNVRLAFLHNTSLPNGTVDYVLEDYYGTVSRSGSFDFCPIEDTVRHSLTNISGGIKDSVISIVFGVPNSKIETLRVSEFLIYNHRRRYDH